SRTTASNPVSFWKWLRSQFWNRCVPLTWIVFRDDRNTSDHFIVQKSAYSGRSSSASTSFARRFGDVSFKKVRTASDDGSTPHRSRYARRMNSLSVQSSDGGIDRSFSLAKTCLSTKLFSAGAFQTNPSRGSRYVRRIVTNSIR